MYLSGALSARSSDAPQIDAQVAHPQMDVRDQAGRPSASRQKDTCPNWRTKIICHSRVGGNPCFKN